MRTGAICTGASRCRRSRQTHRALATAAPASTGPAHAGASPRPVISAAPACRLGWPKTTCQASRQLDARYAPTRMSRKTCTLAHSGFQLARGLVSPKTTGSRSGVKVPKSRSQTMKIPA